MNDNTIDWSDETDERYFVALANEAVAHGDLRGARAFAAQYDSSHGGTPLQRLARRLHLAHAA